MFEQSLPFHCCCQLVYFISLSLLNPTVNVLYIRGVQKTESPLTTPEDAHCGGEKYGEEEEDEEQEERGEQRVTKEAKEGQVHSQVHQHFLAGQGPAKELIMKREHDMIKPESKSWWMGGYSS